MYARAWGSVEKSSRFCDSHTQPSRAHAAEGINSRKTALETYWQPESTDNEDGCLSGQLIKYLAGGQLDTALQYATNRTILLFGDSTERDHVRYACELLQGEHGVILPDTPFWPQPEISIAKPRRGYWLPNEYSARYYPTLCRIRAIDLMIVNVYHYGLQEDGDDDRSVELVPPYGIADRVSQVVAPLMGKIGRNVDIVEFGVGVRAVYWSAGA